MIIFFNMNLDRFHVIFLNKKHKYQIHQIIPKKLFETFLYFFSIGCQTFLFPIIHNFFLSSFKWYRHSCIVILNFLLIMINFQLNLYTNPALPWPQYQQWQYKFPVYLLLSRGFFAMHLPNLSTSFVGNFCSNMIWNM